MISLLCMWIVANAQPLPAPKNPPVITKTSGEAVSAQWKDGNRAVLQVNRNDPFTVTVPFAISENFCGKQMGPAFDAHFAIRLNRMAWVWQQHSDSKMIGQIVRLPESFNGLKLIEPVPITNATRFAHPELVQGLAPDDLQFKTFNWIPGLEDNVLRPVTINEWMSEQMVPNSQTGLKENQIVGEVTGVHLVPTSADTLTVSHMDDGTSRAVTAATMMVGDVVTWLMNKAGKPCQISFKPNLGGIQGKIVSYLGSLPDDNFSAYKWKEDGMSDPQLQILEFVNYVE